jgi:hypothetical protein
MGTSRGYSNLTIWSPQCPYICELEVLILQEVVVENLSLQTVSPKNG